MILLRGLHWIWLRHVNVLCCLCLWFELNLCGKVVQFVTKRVSMAWGLRRLIVIVLACHTLLLGAEIR